MERRGSLEEAGALERMAASGKSVTRNGIRIRRRIPTRVTALRGGGGGTQRRDREDRWSRQILGENAFDGGAADSRLSK